MGGKVGWRKRERFRTAKIMDIAAMAGQKILCSGRGSNMLSSVLPGRRYKKIIMALLLYRKRML